MNLKREVEISAGAPVRGATNRKIGTSLGVSPRTIEKHVERIMAKLGVKNRTCAAMLSKEKEQHHTSLTYRE